MISRIISGRLSNLFPHKAMGLLPAWGSEIIFQSDELVERPHIVIGIT